MTTLPSAIPERDTPLSWSGLFAMSIAMLVAGLLYLNALDNPFVYDDWRVIVENRSIRDLGHLTAILVHEPARPIVNLSYAIDRRLWGSGPFGFHLTNVLLHVLNVGLLFLLAWRFSDDWRQRRHERTDLGQSRVVALTAALLLAVHPMMTQAVGYISARPELLCTLFNMFAHGAVRRAMRRLSVAWLAAAVVCWFLALLSKETAMMFPFVVFCYELFIFPGAREDRRRRFMRVHVPLIGLASFVVTTRLALFAVLEHPGTEMTGRHLLVALDAVHQYLRLLFLPNAQTIFHAAAPIDAFGSSAAIAIAAIAALVAIAWACRRGAGLVSFGLAWFVLRLVPSMTLVVLDRAEPMAEHRVYLASCGLFLACGGAFAWIARRGRELKPRRWRLVRAAALLGLTAMAADTVLRNAVWGSPVALWLEAADRAPDHWLPQLMLGQEFQRAGRCNEAIPTLITATRLRPQEPAGYGTLGVCLLEVHDVEGATQVFEHLRTLAPRSAEASNGLGAAALVSRQPERAVALYRQSLEYDPLNVPARKGLAAAAEMLGDSASALQRCEEIRAIDPETPGNDDCISRNRARLGGGGAS